MFTFTYFSVGKGSKRLSKGPQDLDKDAAVKSSLANADLSMMSKEVSMSREVRGISLIEWANGGISLIE